MCERCKCNKCEYDCALCITCRKEKEANVKNNR